MSIANAHIHHDLHEHEECVKCFAHDHIGNADLIVSEPAASDSPEYDLTQFPPTEWTEEARTSPFNPRAPPFSV